MSLKEQLRIHSYIATGKNITIKQQQQQLQQLNFSLTLVFIFLLQYGQVVDMEYKVSKSTGVLEGVA